MMALRTEGLSVGFNDLHPTGNIHATPAPPGSALRSAHIRISGARQVFRNEALPARQQPSSAGSSAMLRNTCAAPAARSAAPSSSGA